MNSLWLWIGIAIVVIVLIVVFIAIGKKRGESKKVSFEKPKEEEPKQLTQEQKSGNYQAKSGFNFAPAGSKEPEKVAQGKPQQAQPQQAKQEQQPESSEKSEQSEPSATDIANAQLNGEEPPAAKRPEPAKDKDAASTKEAKQEEPQRQEPAADEQPKKSAEPAESKKPAEDGDVPNQDKDTGKADVAGDEAKSESKSESASTSEAESKPAADKPAADKTEGKGTAGTAAAAAAAAGESAPPLLQPLVTARNPPQMMRIRNLQIRQLTNLISRIPRRLPHLLPVRRKQRIKKQRAASNPPQLQPRNPQQKAQTIGTAASRTMKKKTQKTLYPSRPPR